MNGKSFLLDVVIHQEESFSVYVTIVYVGINYIYFYTVYMCVLKQLKKNIGAAM